MKANLEQKTISIPMLMRVLIK